jgi:RNA polymerase sigma-70 factor (ECF subfamily)
MTAVMDEAEVADLRARYGGPLLRLALRLADGDHGRAEDLVQETLIRAWQHPEALADGPALPWLFTVARRLAIDAYRYRRSRPEVSQETLEREPVAGDSIGRALDAQVIAVAVARLSAPHREVIIALYYHDRSVTETADALGIPPGTVKSRSYYALKALRVALEEAVGCAGTGLTQNGMRRVNPAVVAATP